MPALIILAMLIIVIAGSHVCADPPLQTVDDPDFWKHHSFEDEDFWEQYGKEINTQWERIGRLENKAKKTLRKGMLTAEALKAFGSPPGETLGEALRDIDPQGVRPYCYVMIPSGTGCFYLIFVNDRLDYWGYYMTGKLERYPGLP